ncbi:hypothetical protein KC19_10G128800 [Ceratodon purpureus]|uniref:Uncharacterized protein n=1 Tax=Ceratodon purpureus TaxID=3225 RepID=A0A8T0GMM9_CERPU|nr:hypothetical protein KC19_10G128800 [Ceratodon purpureus]
MRNLFPSFVYRKLHLHLGHTHDALEDRSQMCDPTCTSGSGYVIPSSSPIKPWRSHAYGRKRIPSALVCRYWGSRRE